MRILRDTPRTKDATPNLFKIIQNRGGRGVGIKIRLQPSHNEAPPVPQRIPRKFICSENPQQEEKRNCKICVIPKPRVLTSGARDLMAKTTLSHSKRTLAAEHPKNTQRQRQQVPRRGFATTRNDITVSNDTKLPLEFATQCTCPPGCMRGSSLISPKAVSYPVTFCWSKPSSALACCGLR
jgi:hypothetical protein